MHVRLIDSLLSGKHPLAQQMKLYIATPWCKCGEAQEWMACKLCTPSITDIPNCLLNVGDIFVNRDSHRIDFFRQTTPIFIVATSRML